MPYGLTGATQTCQRSLDTILQHCKYCVDNYVNDCIVFSDMTTHIQDLRQVLGKLQAAGLTLRGSKCSFGTDKITHLGFEYSDTGVAPSMKASWCLGSHVNVVALFIRSLRGPATLAKWGTKRR